MPVQIHKRPLRILRRDSGDAAIAISGTLDSYTAPCFGWQVLTLFARLTQTGTIEVYQQLRGSSTFGLTDTWTLTGGGRLRTSVQVTGERIRVLFTNGGTAQSPELVATLDT